MGPADSFERSGFYLLPWLGVGAQAKVNGELDVAGERFSLLSVVGFATLHVGWSFET